MARIRRLRPPSRSGYRHISPIPYMRMKTDLGVVPALDPLRSQPAAENDHRHSGARRRARADVIKPINFARIIARPEWPELKQRVRDAERRAVVEAKPPAPFDRRVDFFNDDAIRIETDTMSPQPFKNSSPDIFDRRGPVGIGNLAQ